MIFIVDHLRPDVLEDLRLLTNYQMDAENRLCLVLIGHPELRRCLTMAVHEAPAQRIVIRHRMAALTRDELAAYLAHRLRLAGADHVQAALGRSRLIDSSPLIEEADHHRQPPSMPGPSTAQRDRVPRATRRARINPRIRPIEWSA